MVSLAHKFAYENQLITSHAVSAVACLELAQNYRVLGTPHTVMNGDIHLKGRITETELLAGIQDLKAN